MRIKIAKLSAIAFSVASVLALSHFGAAGAARAGDEPQGQSQLNVQLSDKLQLVTQEPSQIDVLGRGTTVAERVGEDDGVAFVIHFSGDMHGNLDSCG